jgi:hypothetical protein
MLVRLADVCLDVLAHHLRASYLLRAPVALRRALGP